MQARSLRVALIPILIFADVVFLLFLFLFRFGLFPQENIGGKRVLNVKTFWVYSVHAQWYAVFLTTWATKDGQRQ
jgi:fumarate reductase subunit D